MINENTITNLNKHIDEFYDLDKITKNVTKPYILESNKKNVYIQHKYPLHIAVKEFMKIYIQMNDYIWYKTNDRSFLIFHDGVWKYLNNIDKLIEFLLTKNDINNKIKQLINVHKNSISFKNLLTNKILKHMDTNNGDIKFFFDNDINLIPFINKLYDNNEKCYREYTHDDLILNRLHFNCSTNITHNSITVVMKLLHMFLSKDNFSKFIIDMHDMLLSSNKNVYIWIYNNASSMILYEIMIKTMGIFIKYVNMNTITNYEQFINSTSVLELFEMTKSYRVVLLDNLNYNRKNDKLTDKSITYAINNLLTSNNCDMYSNYDKTYYKYDSSSHVLIMTNEPRMQTFLNINEQSKEYFVDKINSNSVRIMNINFSRNFNVKEFEFIKSIDINLHIPTLIDIFINYNKYI